MPQSPPKAELRLRRDKAEQQKERFLAGMPLCHSQSPCKTACTQRVNPAIVSSWQRSPATLLHRQTGAPRDDEHTIRHHWERSPLRQAAAPELAQLTQLVQEDTFVAAIADPHGKLQWTAASKPLQPFAEATHFIPGGHWAEQASGTNAIGLALTLQQRCTVFAAEHYLPSCHDIVCYAAPIIHPQSGQLTGVLDLTTHWQQHNPLTETAVAHMANTIAQRLPLYLPRAELEIHALGQAWLLCQGQRLHLSQRQLEILCILALHPQGITLEALYHALCRNTTTHPATLKTILTQLRHLLGGHVSPHPYRLEMTVWADFMELPHLIQQNRVAEALKLYNGEFLPTSIAPALEEWRNYLEASMDTLLHHCQDAYTLIDHSSNLLRTPLVRERLLELLAAESAQGLQKVG